MSKLVDPNRNEDAVPVPVGGKRRRVRDVGEPRLSAERPNIDGMRLRLEAHFTPRTKDVETLFAYVEELEAELVAVRERAERLDDAIRDILDVTTGFTRHLEPAERLSVIDKRARAALLAEQEKEQG